MFKNVKMYYYIERAKNAKMQKRAKHAKRATILKIALSRQLLVLRTF